MNYVTAAVLLAATVVGRGYVKKQDAVRFACIGGLKQFISRQICHDKGSALVCELVYRRRRIVTSIQVNIDEQIVLIQEPACRVIVLDRHLGAGETDIGWRHLYE